MTGKHVLLTGYSSGVGRELALKLAAHGYLLGLVGRAEPKDIANAQWIRTDLSQMSEVANVAGRFAKPVDILINCAGVSATGLVEDIPLPEYERCWNVNFASAVSLVQQVLPEMKKRKSGMVVNVTSGVAHRALPFTAPYSSAKAALNAFSDSLRVEVRNCGIHVLLFSPGPVASKFHDNIVHYGDKRRANPPFHGEPPEKIADKLFHAILAKKERVTLGTRANLAHHLQYWSPRATDKIIENLYKLSEK